MSLVDVWIVPVLAGSGDDPGAASVIGHEEAARLASLGFAADRDRATTARLVARRELGRRLGLAPADVPLVATGRPWVSGSALGVGWSHSGSWVALAITPDRPVGVDIEAAVDGDLSRALSALGVRSLEDFVALEAASKATACRDGGAWPRGVVARRISAPIGYLAAVAARGDDWMVELHLRAAAVGADRYTRPVGYRCGREVV